jgi:hypothetical protein
MTGKQEGMLLESHEAPTAFMRIKREVFEILDAAYPHYKDYDTMERGVPYFQTGYVKDPESGKIGFMGEDIFFCRQWCKLGERIWLDPDVHFSHRGSSTWTGKHVDYCIETGKMVKVEPDNAQQSAAA